MLIEFSVENFRSFRDRQTLSLVASKDDSLPGNCFETEGHRLLRSAVIYGPNASGKSNFVRAFAVLRDLVGFSAEDRTGRLKEAKPFRLDTKAAQGPSQFEIIFRTEGVRYRYGFAITPERVHDEWLHASPLGREQLWFRRTYDSKRGQDSWTFGSRLKGEKSRLAKMTRDNRLFLSVASEFNHLQLKKLHAGLRGDLVVVDSYWLWASKHSLFQDLESDEEHRDDIMAFLRSFDLDIDKIKTRELSREEYLRDQMDSEGFAPAKFKALVEAEIKPLAITTYHRAKGMRKLVPFELEDESGGTQRLFALALAWLAALGNGKTVVFDELEASLHPLLSRRLLALFNDPSANQANGQLICATHDTSLMDLKLLRRDQIWFTEKDQDGASHLYSLYDFKKKPRKDEAIQKGYLAGRYGALPVLVDDDAE